MGCQDIMLNPENLSAPLWECAVCDTKGEAATADAASAAMLDHIRNAHPDTPIMLPAERATNGHGSHRLRQVSTIDQHPEIRHRLDGNQRPVWSVRACRLASEVQAADPAGRGRDVAADRDGRSPASVLRHAFFGNVETASWLSLAEDHAFITPHECSPAGPALDHAAQAAADS